MNENIEPQTGQHSIPKIKTTFIFLTSSILGFFKMQLNLILTYDPLFWCQTLSIDQKSLGRNFQVGYYADYICSEVLNCENQNFKKGIKQKRCARMRLHVPFFVIYKKNIFFDPKNANNCYFDIVLKFVAFSVFLIFFGVGNIFSCKITKSLNMLTHSSAPFLLQ